METGYSTGLCGCCHDKKVCCKGFCCPCVLTCKTWAKLNDEVYGCKHCIHPISPFWVRQTIRRRKHMEEENCKDCCTFLFCCCCAVYQDAREVDLGTIVIPMDEFYKGKQHISNDENNNQTHERFVNC